MKILKKLSDILELNNRFLNLWPRDAVPQPKVERLVLRLQSKICKALPQNDHGKKNTCTSKELIVGA